MLSLPAGTTSSGHKKLLTSPIHCGLLTSCSVFELRCSSVEVEENSDGGDAGKLFGLVMGELFGLTTNGPKTGGKGVVCGFAGSLCLEVPPPQPSRGRQEPEGAFPGGRIALLMAMSFPRRHAHTKTPTSNTAAESTQKAMSDPMEAAETCLSTNVSLERSEALGFRNPIHMLSQLLFDEKGTNNVV